MYLMVNVEKLLFYGVQIVRFTTRRPTTAAVYEVRGYRWIPPPPARPVAFYYILFFIFYPENIRKHHKPAKPRIFYWLALRRGTSVPMHWEINNVLVGVPVAKPNITRIAFIIIYERAYTIRLLHYWYIGHITSFLKAFYLVRDVRYYV